MAQVGISILDYYFADGGKPVFYGGGYGSLLVVLSVFTIFGLLYDVNIRNDMIRNITKYVANITLSIYLGFTISDKVTWKFVEKRFNLWYSNGCDKLYPIVVIVNFMVALMIAVCVQSVRSLVRKVTTGMKIRTQRER